MVDYHHAKVAFDALPPFTPLIPTYTLPYLSLVLLASTFSLAFYFTILPKQLVPIREIAVASSASLLGGFGIIALFGSVGVYI